MSGDPAAELRRIAARLRETGQRGIAREMNTALRSATVFLEAAVRQAAGEQLPQRGGLARQQSNQEIRTIVLTSARNAGVRMRTVTRGSMQTDRGFVRHPVFGRWLADQPSQPIPEAAGWWTQTLLAKAPLARPMIEAELAKVAARIEGGI